MWYSVILKIENSACLQVLQGTNLTDCTCITNIKRIFYKLSRVHEITDKSTKGSKDFGFEFIGFHFN